MNADGVPDQIEQALRGLGTGVRREGRDGTLDCEVPVPPEDDPSVAVHEQVVRRWQIVDALDERAGGVILATKVEVVVNGGAIGVTPYSCRGQKRFDFGSKNEGRTVEMVIEGLDDH